MDYEAEDRLFSSFVVTRTDKNGVRWYLTDTDTGTDILNRAKIYRWQDHAEAAADGANLDPAWVKYGCTGWTATRWPEALIARKEGQ